MTPDEIARWPGKTGENGMHPALWHMLDVGAVAKATLPDGPVLALIEDTTGAGKTEAALILAARMMAAGKARGFFLALPTIATSNAMFSRLARIAPALFDGTPSLGLTHGKAHMNDLFREVRGGGSERRRDDVSCSDWLADDRRRVLLADVGTAGTGAS